MRASVRACVCVRVRVLRNAPQEIQVLDEIMRRVAHKRGYNLRACVRARIRMGGVRATSPRPPPHLPAHEFPAGNRQM